MTGTMRRGSHGLGVVRGFKEGRVPIEPEPDAVRGSDASGRERLVAARSRDTSGADQLDPKVLVPQFLGRHRKDPLPTVQQSSFDAGDACRGEGHVGRVLRWIGGLLLALVIMGVGAVGVLMWWNASQPRNFDECMVAEMRGVDAALIENVRAICERRFFVQIKKMPSKGEWIWGADNGVVRITFLSPFSSDYDPWKGEVVVSSKSCESSMPNDFKPISLFALDGGLQAVDVTNGATCMRIEEIWVTRRR